MPNNCYNKLNIKGKPSDIKVFFDKVKSDDYIIDANKIIPYPEKFAKLDKIADEYRKNNPNNWNTCPQDGYNNGGYNWCIDNWGTKWNMYDFSEIVYNDKSTIANISFYTAWSPPEPLIKKLGELFPSLTFTLKYYEQGCGFKGTLKVKYNKVLVDECLEYNGNLGG